MFSSGSPWFYFQPGLAPIAVGQGRGELAAGDADGSAIHVLLGKHVGCILAEAGVANPSGATLLQCQGMSSGFRLSRWPFGICIVLVGCDDADFHWNAHGHEIFARARLRLQCGT